MIPVKHSYLTALLLASLSVAAVAPALLAQTYTITKLDPSAPGLYNYSSGTNINNQGVVLGAGSGQYTTDLITVWPPHQTIGTPVYYFGYNRTTPEGINDSGDIVGYGPDNGSQPHGFFNHSDLGIGYTNAVNNLGQVAGWTSDSLYIYQDGVFDYQPTSYWGSEILSINDSSVAVGYWYTDCSNDCFSQVCIFRGDTITLIGGLDGGIYSEGNDINNRGQIAGWGCTNADCSEYSGFLWTDGQYVIVPSLGGARSNAKAVNDSGVVVGDSYVSGQVQHAIVFDVVNGLRDLNNLIPPGTGWELISASDINNSGQITGLGRYNGLIRAFLLSPPDTSVVIVSPELDQLFIAGENDTIRWYAENVDSVRISVILHWYDIANRVEIPIVDSVPAANESYVWDIPDSLLSRQCRIVIQDIHRPDVADTGADFKIKGYVLTRITNDGEYEAFRPDVHGWSFANSSFVMWPSSWWWQFSYQSGIDPYTNAKYPEFFTSELQADPWWFIDWPLFVRTFGFDTCYTTDTPTGAAADYWPSTATFWAQKSTEHSGSCVGLAATSVAAFGNKDILLQRFPDFGNFDDLYALPLNDTRREIINQLMFTQYAKLPQLNEDTVLRNPNDTWIRKLKNMFLDEDRSNDAFLGIYNSRGGGHAVTPYKLVRDSVPGISGDLYLLYVYDNNHPGDTTRAFAIRPADGFWRYPPTGPSPWLAYGTGLLLEPFSLYFQPAQIPATVPPSDGAKPAAQPHEDYMSLYGLENTSVRIWNGNDSLGCNDSTIFNTFVDARPIVAKTGYLSHPIGYRFPEQYVDVLISDFSDSIANFSVNRPSMIYSVGRTDATPDDSDYFTVRTGIHLWNKDSSIKSLDLQGILIEPGLERVYAVHGFDLQSGDSANFDASPGTFLYFVNAGAAEDYDLTLRLASDSGGMEVAAKNLHMEGNAAHLIWPDWNDLTAPIRIEIDLNHDGPIDDTIYVNAHPTDIAGQSSTALPRDFVLGQNFPNPFNPTTTISYSLPSRSRLTLDIFDVLGRRVRTLVDGLRPAGKYTAEWDGCDDDGRPVSSGVYLYRLTAGQFAQTRKMVLVK